MSVQFDLTDPKLEQELATYFSPPLPISAQQQPSTNAAVFRTPEYIEKLNQDTFQQYLVTVPNIAKWNVYKFELHNYFANKNFQPQPFVTPPPVLATGYAALDAVKFHEVWIKWVPGTNFEDFSFIVTLPVTPAPTFSMSNNQNTDPNASPIGDYDGNGIWFPGPGIAKIKTGDTWTDTSVGKPSSGKTFLKISYSSPFTNGTKSYLLELPSAPPMQNYQ